MRKYTVLSTSRMLVTVLNTHRADRKIMPKS